MRRRQILAEEAQLRLACHVDGRAPAHRARILHQQTAPFDARRARVRIHPQKNKRTVSRLRETAAPRRRILREHAR